MPYWLSYGFYLPLIKTINESRIGFLIKPTVMQGPPARGPGTLSSQGPIFLLSLLYYYLCLRRIKSLFKFANIFVFISVKAPEIYIYECKYVYFIVNSFSLVTLQFECILGGNSSQIFQDTCTFLII